jgi:predicted dehydrogenase
MMAAQALLRVAQIGTRHGHAAGKMMAMRNSPDCTVVGICEPDAAARRHAKEGTQAATYAGVKWFDSLEQLLSDESIEMVAVESHNDANLQHAQLVIGAGKHCWLDKPAGDDWDAWQALVELAAEKRLRIQMGYMLRFNSTWLKVVDWARSGFLGTVYKVRANMSSGMGGEAGVAQYLSNFPGGRYPHRGGLAYDLAPHCLDSILWLMGDRRPINVSGFFTRGTQFAYDDNTVGVLEYENGAMVIIDIDAKAVGSVRRLEVYGTRGTAVIEEPFEPGRSIKLWLDTERGGFSEGEQTLTMDGVERQRTYELDLADFVRLLRSGTDGKPTRPPSHDLLTQETLLRLTGVLPPDQDTITAAAKL